jgi:hypothetical protein
MPGMETAPGSVPLTNEKWELYCHERALCSSRMLAYRNAGFSSKKEHNWRGNAAKLERNPDIRDRIAWFCRQPEEVIRAKRDRLEGYLWGAMNFDIADYFLDSERPVLTKDGEPVLDRDGKPMFRIVQELKPFSELDAEQRAVIQGLKYTDSGRPIIELASKMQANIELRKMLGIGAAAKATGDEISEMSLDELKAFIAREQIALGINELLKRANAGVASQAEI